MFTIMLPENPTAEQVVKANQVMAFIAGVEVMGQVHAMFQQRMAAPAPAPAPAPDAAKVFATDAPPAPAPPAVAVALEFDASGLPWDARIHSGNKTKNQDGSWKARKGIDEATKTAVTAELRAVHPHAAVSAPPPPAPAHAAAAPPPPPPAPAHAAAAPPPPPGGTGPLDFTGLMSKYTGYIGAGKLTPADMIEACKSVGIASAPMLATRPDLVPAVGAFLDATALTR